MKWTVQNQVIHIKKRVDLKHGSYFIKEKGKEKRKKEKEKDAWP